MQLNPAELVNQQGANHEGQLVVVVVACIQHGQGRGKALDELSVAAGHLGQIPAVLNQLRQGAGLRQLRRLQLAHIYLRLRLCRLQDVIQNRVIRVRVQEGGG